MLGTFIVPIPQGIPRSPNARRTSRPRDTGFTFHRTQQLWKQGADTTPSFCLFWPREGGDAQAERRLRRRQVPRAPPPVLGPGAETERGVTKRRRNAEVSALAPRALSGPEARPSLSRLGPASAGRALRPRWAQPLSRRRLGAAKHPGRTRSRRKVA